MPFKAEIRQVRVAIASVRGTVDSSYVIRSTESICRHRVDEECKSRGRLFEKM